MLTEKAYWWSDENALLTNTVTYTSEGIEACIMMICWYPNSNECVRSIRLCSVDLNWDRPFDETKPWMKIRWRAVVYTQGSATELEQTSAAAYGWMLAASADTYSTCSHNPNLYGYTGFRVFPKQQMQSEFLHSTQIKTLMMMMVMVTVFRSVTLNYRRSFDQKQSCNSEDRWAVKRMSSRGWQA